MKVTTAAVKRRIATSVITVALIVLGIYGFLRLPVNFLPDMTYPMIKVHIWWRGATPEEIETNLAEPIERQMATVDGLDYLESSSIEGMYTLVANFKYGINIDVAYQDALAAMARVARQLPKDIDPPIVIKADPTQLPVVQLTVKSEQWDLVQLRTWVDQWLQDQLLSVAGVAGTEIVGGLKREIRVHLDPAALEKYSLSLPVVLKRLQEENIEQFGGRVTSGSHEYIARTMGEYQSVESIGSILLARKGQAKIYLRDIAEIKDAHEEARVITRLGGQPCVKLSVLKQADANTVAVAEAVGQRIRELGPVLPAGIELGMVENQADYVSAALNGVRSSAGQAAVLVILVVYLFLGSWRHALVMLLALPVTVVLNFALMKLGGFSLNIFSLGGLVVAIGVVLDNSIVVLENITRLRRLKPQDAPAKAAIDGTAEVGSAILSATLAFLALFVPFLLVPGLTSLLFRELILVIAGIVVVSLSVAVSVTPMLTDFLTAGHQANEQKSLFERFFDRVTNTYGTLLRFTLKARWFVIPTFLCMLVGAVILAPRVGSEFLPQMDDGRVMVKVKLPTGAAVAQTESVLAQIEQKLAGDPLIESYFTLAGGKVWGLYTYEIANEGQIDIQLAPRRARKVTTEGYIRSLRTALADAAPAGGKVMVMQAKIKGLRKMGEADIEVKIKGQKTDELFSLARQTADALKGSKHFANVYVSLDMNKPELKVIPDRVRAAELGVSIADVAGTLKSLVSGAVATRYRDGDEFYNVRVMIPEEKINSQRDLEQLILNCAQDGYLRLSDVAEIRPAVGPVEIIRENQVKEVIVRTDAAGVSVGQALSELQNAVRAIAVPVGYEIIYGGQAQMMAEMVRTILMIFGFAIFFAFVVLAVQFNSLKLPGLILVSAPFCLAGMVYTLYFAGLPLGATVIIAALVVVAAAINGGVLLAVLAEELRESGKTPLEAVVDAAKVRLRPRLMVTLTTVVGFIPLALNIGEGGDMLQSMAVAAIGGLSMGLLVALFLMPCIYMVVSSGGSTGPKQESI